MYEVFTKLLNMSLTASFLVLTVIVLRLVLKKAPKKYICILWALVAIRLICPFSISSAFSAYNVLNQETVSNGQVEYFEYNGKSEKPQLTFEVPALINDNYDPDSMTVGTKTSGVYMPTAVYIWLFGVIGMFSYALVSYLRLHKEVKASIKKDGDIYVCDEIASPFILGIIRPGIYIPSGISEDVRANVIAHEQAHIKRLDYIWKPLGFLLLTVYWFNPMMWIAYIFLCRDIEAACDEKVISQMDKEHVAGYSEALLACAMRRRMITACPLAFGETDVKGRIKNVLNYKKPAFWIVGLSIISCILVALFFLTNPKDDDNNQVAEEIINDNSQTEMETQLHSDEAELQEQEVQIEEEQRALTEEEALIKKKELIEEAEAAFADERGNFFNGQVSDSPKWDDFGFDCWPLASGQLRDEWSKEEPCWQFTAPKGTPVYAVMDGNVVGGYNYDDGNYVILSINDVNNTHIKYSHLETQYYENPGFVTAGTEIGTVGATGKATGPFLRIDIATGSYHRKITEAETLNVAFCFDGVMGSLVADISKEATTQPVLIELALRDNNNNAIWKAEVGVPSAGWNSYYTYNRDGENYIIQYYPCTSQGLVSYSFVMYKFDADGHATIVDERYAQSTEELSEFLEYTKPYMDNAKLFISTINGIVTTEVE